MTFQSIKISEVLIENSRFSLKDYLFESLSKQSCYFNSFDALGMLYPITVYMDDKQHFHLIDGRKRIQFAKQNQKDIIHATVLPESTPITDIIMLLFCNKKTEIEASTINKVHFIHFANLLNAPESWILQNLCIPFEFKPHRDFLRECERITQLPKEMKLFCHEKKFSLKQLLNLTYHPYDLLVQLIKWKSSLHLTASILDEIASNLKDYLKAHDMTMSDFITDPDVNEIMESSLSPRDKTERLRRLIYTRRFPVLSEVNSRIQKTVNNLNLPEDIFIDWDRTLENKDIKITVHVRDPRKWQDIMDTLNSIKIKKAVESILEEL
jgi:hypothetical protein